MLNNDLLNAFAAAVSTLGVALSVHIYDFFGIIKVILEGCSYMSQIFCTNKKQTTIFSLRFTALVDQPLAESHHSFS